MKKALISTFERKETGYRVCQVVNIGEEFLVSPDLIWIDCDDSVIADEFWYDPTDSTIKPISEPITVANPNQPNTTLVDYDAIAKKVL